MAFGATVTYAKELMHGKESLTYFDTSSIIFSGIPNESKVARYHSLAASKDTIPHDLKVVAKTDDGEVMAVEHIHYPIYGLQFHPESIMTEYGSEMLRNFIQN